MHNHEKGRMEVRFEIPDDLLHGQVAVQAIFARAIEIVAKRSAREMHKKHGKRIMGWLEKYMEVALGKIMDIDPREDRTDEDERE